MILCARFPVDFSAHGQHDVLATLWARTRVDDLMAQDFNGAQAGNDEGRREAERSPNSVWIIV